MNSIATTRASKQCIFPQPYSRQFKFVRPMGSSRDQKKNSRPKKPALTHFLCLPIVTPDSRPQLEQSLARFRNAVEARGDDGLTRRRGSDDNQTSSSTRKARNIHPKAIRPVGTLHLTLGVMSLNDDTLPQAKCFLESLDIAALLANASGGGEESSKDSSPDTESSHHAQSPLKIRLRGLESMHAPTKTSVLFAPPEEPTKRLYPFCLAVEKLFKQKGFLIDQNRQLILHATIINTVYAKGKKMPAEKAPSWTSSSKPVISVEDDNEAAYGANSNAPLTLDVRDMLRDFEDFIWADVKLERLALWEMGAKKITDNEGNAVDERYNEVASIDLPS